jgi:hypothetical protein
MTLDSVAPESCGPTNPPNDSSGLQHLPDFDSRRSRHAGAAKRPSIRPKPEKAKNNDDGASLLSARPQLLDQPLHRLALSLQLLQ